MRSDEWDRWLVSVAVPRGVHAHDPHSRADAQECREVAVGLDLGADQQAQRTLAACGSRAAIRAIAGQWQQRGADIRIIRRLLRQVPEGILVVGIICQPLPCQLVQRLVLPRECRLLRSASSTCATALVHKKAQNAGRRMRDVMSMNVLHSNGGIDQLATGNGLNARSAARADEARKKFCLSNPEAHHELRVCRTALLRGSRHLVAVS